MRPVTSSEELEDLVRARYTLIYIVSSEEQRVEKAIREIGQRRGRKVLMWSITEGFQSPDAAGENYTDVKDPLRALDFVVKFEDNAIFVLRDFHPYLQDPSVVRRLRDANKIFKVGNHFRHIVLLSPTLKTPLELEKEMAVLDYELPGRDVIDGIVNSLQASVGVPNLAVRNDPELRERVVEAALGLTADEAENVFAKSLVRTRQFDLDTILGEKKHIIRKSGILEFYETNYGFGDVGGLATLKDWLEKRQLAFSSRARDFGLPLPRGILLVGVPGCGKSLTAKAVGAYWKMPLLRLDVGKVFSSLVGSSEENMRKAFRTAEAVAPSILWLDELEKGFTGTKSSGQSDAGTTARVFGSFITWLQEKTAPVFVMATANDVSMLPPELLRKGRFDEIFFVDLPSPAERADILRIHIQHKKRDPAGFDIDKLVAGSRGFSGSEIEQAIVSALYDAFMDGQDINTSYVLHSLEEIIPLSYTMKEAIDGMREWAKSRARRASPEDESAKEKADVRELEI